VSYDPLSHSRHNAGDRSTKVGHAINVIRFTYIYNYCITDVSNVAVKFDYLEISVIYLQIICKCRLNVKTACHNGGSTSGQMSRHRMLISLSELIKLIETFRSVTPGKGTSRTMEQCYFRSEIHFSFRFYKFLYPSFLFLYYIRFDIVGLAYVFHTNSLSNQQYHHTVMH